MKAKRGRNEVVSSESAQERVWASAGKEAYV